MEQTVRPFSSGYYLVDATIREFTGERVAAPHDLLAELGKHVELPLLKLAGGHYQPFPQRGMPANTVAVPYQFDIDTEQELLMAKDEQVMEMIFESDPGPA